MPMVICFPKQCRQLRSLLRCDFPGQVCVPVIHAAEFQSPTNINVDECAHAEVWTSVFHGPTSSASYLHVLWFRCLVFPSVQAPVSEAMAPHKRPASRGVVTQVVVGHPAYRLVKDPRPVQQVARAPAFAGLEYSIARSRFS